MAFKHVGRIKTNKRKVIVAYKTVPNEPEQCLVVTTENLDKLPTQWANIMESRWDRPTVNLESFWVRGGG